MSTPTKRIGRTAGRLAALAGVGAVALTLAGCAGTSSGGSGGASVSIAGFSVMQTANKQVIADFQKTADGKGSVGFR